MIIIGVSAYYHAAAACLVQDGEIKAAAQEERFSRKKHAHRFPIGAFDYCLKEGGLKGPEDVDYVMCTHLHADHVIDFYNFAALPGFGVNDSNDGILPPAAGQPKVQVYGPGRAGGLPPADDPAPPTINPDNPTPGISDLYEMQMASFAYSTNLFMRRCGLA